MGKHRAGEAVLPWSRLRAILAATADVVAGDWECVPDDRSGGSTHNPMHVDVNRQPGRSMDGVPDDDLIPGMRHPDDGDRWDR